MLQRAHIGIKVELIDDGDHRSNVNAGSAPPVARCYSESVTGDDYLMCSDTEDAAVKSAHKKIHMKGAGLLWSHQAGPLEGCTAAADRE